MNLAQESPEVVDTVDRVGGQDHLARGRGHVAQVGEIGLQTLDLDLGLGCAAAGLGDAFDVGVDGDRLRTGASERHRVEPG